MVDQASEGRSVEYQVVGMTGSPKVSGIYRAVERGDDALLGARAIQRARGGVIMRRAIDIGPWQTLGPGMDGDTPTT
jgi:hypothetical protein